MNEKVYEYIVGLIESDLINVTGALECIREEANDKDFNDYLQHYKLAVEARAEMQHLKK
jgi:hypothetical protein